MSGKIGEQRQKTPGKNRGVSRKRQSFSHGFGLKTVVMILEATESSASDESQGIDVLCRGLDSSGGVFGLELIFTPESQEEGERLLQDLKAGALFVVKGEYSIFPEESLVRLYNPIYYPVSLHFSEQEIREVLRVNGISMVRK